MKILLTDDSSNWLAFHANAIAKIFPEGVSLTYAKSAREGVDALTLNIDEPFDVIFTDMQMESDFLPLFAGEWFIKQIKTFKEYDNTKIIAVSAATNLKQIALKYGVSYLPKYICSDLDNYKKVL